MAGIKEDTAVKVDRKPEEDQVIVKRFNNGWTPELEDLIADWADKAACYRWMHERTHIQYKRINQGFMIPIIVLSTLSGVANFGMDSIIGNNDDMKKWATLGVGGVSIFAAILTTLVNFFAYAKLSEANFMASSSWGKFNRLLCIEMRLHPDERTDSLVFLKMFRVELDRLVEQSPTIPDDIIASFNKLFSENDKVAKPEITGILERTDVFRDTSGRLKKMAAEAALMLHQKKGIIKQLVLDDLKGQMDTAAEEASRRVMSEEKIRIERAIKASNITTSHINNEAKKAERKEELAGVSRAKVVQELRDRFTVFPSPPPNITILTPQTTIDTTINRVDEKV